MKAAVLEGRRDIVYRDIETPIVGDIDVLVEIKACGICGSDIPRYMDDAAHFYPIVLGHEFSGKVVEVGNNVDQSLVGKRVSVAPLMPCHECLECQKGLYSLCSNYKFIGSRVNGAFADYVAVPYKNIVTFPDTVDYKTGAFFEPSTIALHGLKCANYCGGKNVAILGVGTIGIFTVQWAKLLGAKKVVVFDIDDTRLELAKKIGADEGFNTLNGNFIEEAKAYVGTQFDFVFETAGNQITMRYAFHLAGNRSSICFIGTSSKDLTFSWKEFELMNRKEFYLTGSWMGYSAPFPGDEWAMTADYFAENKLVILDEFIDTIYEMKDAKEAFERFANPRDVSGKLLLVNK